MRTESVTNPGMNYAQQSSSSKSARKSFNLFLKNVDQLVRTDASQFKVNNAGESTAPQNMEEILSLLGLSSEDQKIFLEFLSKLEQINSQDDESEELIVDLLRAIQSLIQTEPSNLKEAIQDLSGSNKDIITQLIQNSSLPDDVDLKIAYFILLGQASNNNNLKSHVEMTNSNINHNQALNEVIIKIFGQQNQPGAFSNQDQVKQNIAKLLQFIEGNSSQTKGERNEYLLSLYKRNFARTVDQNGVISKGMNKSTVSKINLEVQANLVKQSTNAAAIDQDSNQQATLPISKTQQFVLFVAQNQNENAPNQERFIQDFKNILAKSQLSLNNGQSKLLIKLYPEHLGSVQIELIHQDKMLVAKIMTATANAKELIESQIQHLKHTLLAQNIPVEKIEISQQLHQQFEESFYRDQHHEQQQQEKSTQDQQQTGELNDQERTFAEELLNFQV